MSKRRDIERHLHSLGEIREIMNAMKNLAFMETSKLARLIETQQKMAASIRSAAADFLSFHPDLADAPACTSDMHLVVGSERGFCGDFNERLIEAWQARPQPKGGAAIITIGSKLATRWPDNVGVVAALAGASALEEIEEILLKTSQALETWHRALPSSHGVRLTVFHHGPRETEVSATRLAPFSEREPAAPRFSYAPLLNLERHRFLRLLAEHYLFAELHQIFYGSLLAENQQRMQHMDHAVRSIDEKTRELGLERNSLRQEEITEEIEVIMLSVDAARW